MRKLAVFITSILILLFCVGCNKETTPENKTTSTETEDSVTQDVAVYNDILDIYQKLVTFYLSDAFEENWNNGNIPQWYDTLNSILPEDKEEYRSHLSNMVVTMKGALNTVTQDSFGYILLDINNDAFPELFWVREDHSILAVFTVADGEVSLLDAFWNRYVCVITPDNRLYTRGSSGADITAYAISRLSSKGKLIPEFVWGTEHIDVSPGWHYYEIVDGEKTVIDEARHYALITEYPFNLSEAWRAKPIAPLKYTSKAESLVTVSLCTSETYITNGKFSYGIRYNYDSNGNLVDKITNHNNKYLDQYTYIHDSTGRVIEEIRYHQNVEQFRDTYVYDSKGNLTAIILYDGDVGPHCTAYTYNESGNKTHEFYFENWFAKKSLTYIYDEDGHVVQTNSWYSSVYDSRRYHTFTYDACGNVIEMISFDSDNNITGRQHYSYDDHGNLTDIVYYDHKGDVSHHYTYFYNAEGYLKEAIYYDNGIETARSTYEYVSIQVNSQRAETLREQQEKRLLLIGSGYLP